MFTGRDLKEYRIMEGLTQRDVARYCEVCHELIGQVERGVVGVTEYNHAQIVKGINGAIQAKARGTFEADKEKERQEEKAKADAKKLEQVAKPTTPKKTTTKKSVKADTEKK